MTTHAPSQISLSETTRLLIAALNNPSTRASFRLVRARAVSTQEMLGRWTVETSEGPLHRVALIRVIDGEVMGFDECYLDEADAISVWQHLADEAANPDPEPEAA